MTAYGFGQLIGLGLLGWIAYDLGIRQPRKKREAEQDQAPGGPPPDDG